MDAPQQHVFSQKKSSSIHQAFEHDSIRTVNYDKWGQGICYTKSKIANSGVANHKISHTLQKLTKYFWIYILLDQIQNLIFIILILCKKGNFYVYVLVLKQICLSHALKG